jgi:DNA-binding MarR family transcriptional regulator
MKQSDLTENQLKIMQLLSNGQWQSRSSMRDATGIPISTIQKVTNRLEQFKLIRSSVLGDPINSYLITDEGKKLFDAPVVEPVAQPVTEAVLEHSVEVQTDIEFVKAISLDFVRKLQGETSLERITTYSIAASHLASTYAMLSQPIMEFVVDEKFSKS